MIQVTVEVNLEPLKKFGPRLEQLAEKIVRRAAFAIESDAKNNAPVDTGALRASIYTVTHNYNARDAAIAAAKQLYPGPGRNEKTWPKGSVPRTDPPPIAGEVPEIKDKFTAYVAVGMEYGIWVEYGHDNIPPQPYLVPAANKYRQQFKDEIAKAVIIAARDSGWR